MPLVLMQCYVSCAYQFLLIIRLTLTALDRFYNQLFCKSVSLLVEHLTDLVWLWHKYLSEVFVMLQTLASVLTYWTFRKWIHSSSWLFVFWLLQLIAVVVEFHSLMIRVITV